jgi:hypothetical protein
MTRPIKLLSGTARFGAVAIVAATGLATPQAQAIFCAAPPSPLPPGMGSSCPPKGSSGNNTVATGGHEPNLNFSDSNLTGNIEIGGTYGFVGTSPSTITGTVQFAAPNTGQFQPNGVTVTGGATFNNANVQTDLNALNTLSQNFRNEGGTSQLIAAGGSVNASSGILDPSGNEVFNATIAPSFTAGTAFTINGTSSQFVVFNIGTGGLPFDGRIVLTGGITSDQVLFNFDAGNFDTNTGGDPLTINTDGLTTTGTYLDPNGQIQIVNSVLDGRIFGGDSADFGISNSTIVAPVPAPLIGRGLPVLLAVGGMLFGAKLLERSKKRRSPGTAAHA